MTSFHIHTTRTHTHSPIPPSSPRRSRNIITLSDDNDDSADDYPYSSPHRPSRALTLRPQPSQLERYNIWTDPYKPSHSHSERRERSHSHSHSRERVYNYTSTSQPDRIRYSSIRITRPNDWPGEGDNVLRRKEKVVDEGWETRERSRSCGGEGRRDAFWEEGGFWGDERESEDERVTRYRKVKKTRTEEWRRPLSGWRRG